MDEKFFCRWFRGFERGLDAMDADGRRCLLRHCAKQCADTGVLQAYLRLYQDVEGDRDEFYRRLSETGGVRAEIVVPGREYEICFPDCACDIHTAGGVNTPHLCECSRQSILYVAQTVWRTDGVQVEAKGTVLSGAKECRFRVTFRQQPDTCRDARRLSQ